MEHNPVTQNYLSLYLYQNTIKRVRDGYSSIRNSEAENYNLRPVDP